MHRRALLRRNLRHHPRELQLPLRLQNRTDMRRDQLGIYLVQRRHRMRIRRKMRRRNLRTTNRMRGQRRLQRPNTLLQQPNSHMRRMPPTKPLRRRRRLHNRSMLKLQMQQNIPRRRNSLPRRSLLRLRLQHPKKKLHAG